jgi:hypothetical protein
MTYTQHYFRNKTDGRILHTFGAMDAEWVQLTNKDGLTAYREQAREDLRQMLKPGDKVYTVLRHVSTSGMTRRISLFVMCKGEPACIDWGASIAMDDKQHKDGGIVVSGCGMDMGFHLVYNLGRTLWPNGTDKPHGTRNGRPDTDGGYALKHVWL